MLVSKYGYIDDSVCRDLSVFRVKAGSFEGTCRGASAVRSASAWRFSSVGGFSESPILEYVISHQWPSWSDPGAIPATSRALAPLEHSDQIERLLLRQRINGYGARRPCADDGNALHRYFRHSRISKGSALVIRKRASW